MGALLEDHYLKYFLDSCSCHSFLKLISLFIYVFLCIYILLEYSFTMLSYVHAILETYLVDFGTLISYIPDILALSTTFPYIQIIPFSLKS